MFMPLTIYVLPSADSKALKTLFDPTNTLSHPDLLK
jgi:hypothetical protein